jgi:BirA family transcriptional regulator, biotin operon repressor / biotin---[acetyl-CoA-carboxylase] ligase
MALHPEANAAGARLISYDVLGSTNAEGLARARAGAAGPLWITAIRQTAGRGRRANAWSSQPGNLYASLLLTDLSAPEHAPQLSFVAALAVHDAIGALAPRLRARLKLKWPNDVLVDGLKVCGILIEAESGQGRFALVIGIGVNCVSHPADAAFPASNLAGAGAQVTPRDLLEALARTMQARIAQWERGVGFAAIRAEWLARAAGVGATIRVRLPERELSGRFETLDQAGRLMLRLPGGGIEPITAGEVFGFAAPAEAAL